MAEFLQSFIWVSLAGFTISLFLPRKNEGAISYISFSTVGIHLAGILSFIFLWILNGSSTLDIKHTTLYKTGNVEIFIDFLFDSTTAVFALIGSLLTLLVLVFSRYYMHRDGGFKRFFVTVLFFFLGYNLIIFSGNFETLFVGWEILGICSFLLIAFYRDRYLPVKNSIKVISVYRLADACLILAMWMSHHLWHENITFLKLNNSSLVQSQIQSHYSIALFITLMVILAAIIKSAQLPFSSWLPRAMEGPTTSSAIFYGSLSVHLGAFLLLRTYPFWQQVSVVKIFVLGMGVATALIATGISMVQSTVKTQIAYSSVAQIGIIFIEIALGFHTLALIHFAGNAFLRTYQLLVSPSVMSYLIHDQFYNFSPSSRTERTRLLKKINYTFYTLCIKEWNIDFLLQKFLWNPFKEAGKKLKFITQWPVILLFVIFYAVGVYFFIVRTNETYPILPGLFSIIALAFILKAFTDRGDASKTWLLISASQFLFALSVSLNESFDFIEILMYLSGGIISSVAGFACLLKVKSIDKDISLNKFHGYTYEQPAIGLLFLLACLGMVAFPITPAFLGFDLLLTYIHHDQVALIALTGLFYIFIELAVLRIYCRVFLGQHKKPYHAMAFRSS
ncbi:MAG TPA: proton-conducting transporter membrane subunit [Cyclobacteriaceae bacterium]|nr:proton-conducting transporter membrane subunit [Cyclobacteriaceae bacterium]